MPGDSCRFGRGLQPCGEGRMRHVTVVVHLVGAKCERSLLIANPLYVLISNTFVVEARLLAFDWELILPRKEIHLVHDTEKMDHECC